MTASEKSHRLRRVLAEILRADGAEGMTRKEMRNKLLLRGYTPNESDLGNAIQMLRHHGYAELKARNCLAITARGIMWLNGAELPPKAPQKNDALPFADIEDDAQWCKAIRAQEKMMRRQHPGCDDRGIAALWARVMRQAVNDALLSFRPAFLEANMRGARPAWNPHARSKQSIRDIHEMRAARYWFFGRDTGFEDIAAGLNICPLNARESLRALLQAANPHLPKEHRFEEDGA